MPCHFAHKCKEMLREHLHAWSFARVTSVKVSATGFYYGFAQELEDPRARRAPRTVWFKGGKEVSTLVLGPVLFSSAGHGGGGGGRRGAPPPVVGSVVAGRVVQPSHFTTRTDMNRFDWWYRDGAPLRHLWGVVHDIELDRAMLCKNTRYLPNLSLDNLWALSRLMVDEDVQSFVDEYLPSSHQQLHPLRGRSGKRGYVLDRPVYRFILDTAIFFGLPCIYHAFETRMRQRKLQLELTPHLRRLLRQELQDFQESVHIQNDITT